MRKKKSLRIFKNEEEKIMQINNHQQIPFGEKYNTSHLISCACKTQFIRKSESVNLLTSILKLTKKEKKTMIHNEDVFQTLLKRAGNHILTQIPELNTFTDKINKFPQEYHKMILELAENKLGEEIDIKRLVRSQEARKNKSWIYKYQNELP